MSLLALLAGEPGPATPPPSGPLNTVSDGQLSEQMRPSWDTIIRVGPARTYTTIESAASYARSVSPYGKPGAGTFDGSLGGYLYRGGRPYYARTLLLIDPGTYTVPGILDVGDWLDIRGNGASRAEVVIQTDGTFSGRYPLRFWGSMYAGNLTLRHVDGPAGGANDYPMHGSTAFGSHFTAVFDNVHFLNENTGANGIAGWDMPNGMRAFLYRCKLESTVAGKDIVFHDMPGNTAGVEATFIQCSGDITWRVNSVNGKCITYECTKLDGSPVADSIAVNNQTATAYTGGMPAVPSGGMTAAEESKYVPLAGASTSSPAYGTIANASHPADRTFFIPFTSTNSALVLDKVQLAVSSSSGVSVDFYVGDYLGPRRSVMWSQLDSMVGIVSKTTTDYAFIDRGETYWLGVRISASGSAVTASSATIAAGGKCLYRDAPSLTNGSVAVVDPTTLSVVPSGTAVPAPVILGK